MFHYMNIYHVLFIYSSMDGHLGYFCYLAVMNNATVTIHVQAFCAYMFSFLLSVYLGVELLVTC